MKHLGRKEKIHNVFFNDGTYSKILDSIVIACVDIMITSGENILLVKRNIEPRKGHWWILGGRMIAGESPIICAKRKLLKDVGFDLIDESRLQYFNTYSTYFNIRHQEPKNNGSHTVNITYLLELSQDELSELVFDKYEYADYVILPKNDVKKFLESKNEDEYITTIINDLL